MNVLQHFNSVPRIRQLAAHVWQHFREDRLFDEAASMSYTSLLSMVPLLAVVFGVASAFPVFEQWSDRLRAFVLSNFVPASGEQVQAYLASFLDSVGGLTLPGTLLLIVTALLLMVRIERAFNQIWRVPSARSFRNRVAMYWAVLTLGPLALGAAAALGAQPLFETLARGAGGSGPWRLLGVFVLSWLAFTLVFLLVPNRRVQFSHAAVGGLLSAFLFSLAKKGFVVFVSKASFNVIYGTLATIPIFLFWLYVVWVVVLLGASLAASLTTFKDRTVTWGWPAKWRFLLAYRVVGYLFRAQSEGRTLATEDLMAEAEGATEAELVGLLMLFYDAGLVTRDEDGEWLLCRDLDSVSLLDLYRAGNFYLPVDERFDIPSESEWDSAFFQSLSTTGIDMDRPLKALYSGQAGTAACAD
ncbi:MAG: YihY family inner membrane protein [Lysobacterales bacterium]|jgi:membrane protein